MINLSRCYVTQLAILLMVACNSAFAVNWSCGSRIVSTNDSKAEVLIKCGEPTWKDSHVNEHYEKYRGNIVGGSTENEVWIYNLGPSQLTRALHFKNGALTQIDTGEHGFYLNESTPRNCRPEELNVGLDRYTVWAKCGEPLVKDQRVEKRVRGNKHAQDVHYVNIDEWTYNFGTQRFMRLLRFENSRLIEIEEIGRGK